MKVLWLCNIMLPCVAKSLNRTILPSGGWMSGLLSEIISRTDHQIMVCFPDSAVQNTYFGRTHKLEYMGFPAKLEGKYQLRELREEFGEVLRNYAPHVVHIFGSEFGHTLAMLQAGEKLGLLDHMVVSIQGLVSVYAHHYQANLPVNVVHGYSLRDVLKKDNVHRSAMEYASRGVAEIEALKLCRHIMGRTDWDEACVKRISPHAKYYHCNEILRSAFYKNVWSLDTCKRHSLFVSQWYSPIKGFHVVLEAMKDLVKVYPDLQLFTTGRNPLTVNLKERMLQSYYVKYICHLIKKYGLQDHIQFLGVLDEQSMCQQYVNAHVFLSASSIENSPNSVGEAMLLGTPVISSDVGGVKNMMTHNQDGFVYPFDEPYMLSYYIDKIFKDDQLAFQISKSARKHANKTHHRVANMERTCQIYEEIRLH